MRSASIRSDRTVGENLSAAAYDVGHGDAEPSGPQPLRFVTAQWQGCPDDVLTMRGSRRGSPKLTSSDECSCRTPLAKPPRWDQCADRREWIRLLSIAVHNGSMTFAVGASEAQ